MELDLYGFVGLFMLIGIVKKNAIMVVDFAVESEREGKSPLDSAVEGCLVRFSADHDDHHCCDCRYDSYRQKGTERAVILDSR